MLDSDWKLGSEIEGRYRILELIGAGGMGMVFKAQDNLLNRVVAIKKLSTLSNGSSESSEAYLRFCREGQSLCKLNNQNVVAIYNMGLFKNEFPYLVMEYVPGRSLKSFTQELGPLPWPQALEITSQICRGLSSAHALGVIHRDIKPENILMMCEGEQQIAKIADFGLCRQESNDSEHLTRTGLIIGTVQYMAPEIPLGRTTTPAVDVYSLACLLHELLTGETLFNADSVPGMIFKHCHEAPPLLKSKFPGYSWPSELEKLLQNALAKEPGQRLTLSEFSKRVDHLLSQNALSVRPPNTEPESRTKPAGSKTLANLRQSRYLAALIPVSAIVALLLALTQSPIGIAFLFAHCPDLLPAPKMLQVAELCLTRSQDSNNKQEFDFICDYVLKKLPAKPDDITLCLLCGKLQKTAMSFHDNSRAKLAGLAALSEQSQALKQAQFAPNRAARVSDLLRNCGDTADIMISQKALSKDDCQKIIRYCSAIPVQLLEDGAHSKTEAKCIFQILTLYRWALVDTKSNDIRLLRGTFQILSDAAQALGQEEESCLILEQSIEQMLNHDRKDWACQILSQLGMRYFQLGRLSKADAVVSACLNGRWHEKPCCLEHNGSSVSALYCLLHLKRREYSKIVSFLLPNYMRLLIENKGKVEHHDFLLCTAALVFCLSEIGKESSGIELLHEFKRQLPSANAVTEGADRSRLNQGSSDKEVLEQLNNLLRSNGTFDDFHQTQKIGFSQQDWQKLWNNFQDSKIQFVPNGSVWSK